MFSIQITWKMGFLERLELLKKIYASLILFEEYHKSSPCIGKVIVAQASCTHNCWKHLMLGDSFIRVAFWGLSRKHIVLWNLELKWIPLVQFETLFIPINTFCNLKQLQKFLLHWWSLEFMWQCVCCSTFFISQASPIANPPKCLSRH